VVIGMGGERCARAPQNQAKRAFGVHRREGDRHRATLGKAQEESPIDARIVEDRSQVVDALVPGRDP
jgi:hypothetical protein